MFTGRSDDDGLSGKVAHKFTKKVDTIDAAPVGDDEGGRGGFSAAATARMTSEAA